MIKCHLTLSPHIVDGTPRGYYLITHRLFPKTAPNLRKDQFAGCSGCLVVTIGRDRRWGTLTDMGIRAMNLDGKPAVWLGKTRLYRMAKGFRMYIPSTILKPMKDAQKIETFGYFDSQKYGGGVETLYYMKIPLISAEVLMGQKSISHGSK